MRILDVSPMAVCPPRRGSAARTYNLLRHLGARHQVRQFSLSWDDPLVLRPRIDERRGSEGYTELRFRHPVADAINAAGKRAWVSAPLLSGLALAVTRPRVLTELLDWADVALVEFPWQYEYCRRRRRRPGGLVLASHNVESLKFPSWAESAGVSLTRPWLSYVARAETSAARDADLVLAVSPEDRDHYVEHYGVASARVVNVPNGADTERLAPVGADARRGVRRRLGLPDRPTVLYVASDIPPNRAGAEWVRRVAAASHELSFVAVGPGALVGDAPPNLLCTGYVDDVRPWFAAADLALCPIAHGGGTKIKLLEYLASGLPAVAFEQALHGVGARDGVEVLAVEASVDGLRAGLERLVGDPGLAHRMGLAARQLAVERYDWSRIAAGLEEALSALIASRPRPRSWRGGRRSDGPPGGGRRSAAAGAQP